MPTIMGTANSCLGVYPAHMISHMSQIQQWSKSIPQMPGWYLGAWHRPLFQHWKTSATSQEMQLARTLVHILHPTRGLRIAPDVFHMALPPVSQSQPAAWLVATSDTMLASCAHALQNQPFSFIRRLLMWLNEW